MTIWFLPLPCAIFLWIMDDMCIYFIFISNYSLYKLNDIWREREQWHYRDIRFRCAFMSSFRTSSLPPSSLLILCFVAFSFMSSPSPFFHSHCPRFCTHFLSVRVLSMRLTILVPKKANKHPEKKGEEEEEEEIHIELLGLYIVMVQ